MLEILRRRLVKSPMPLSSRASLCWTVMWKDRRTGHVVSGEPVERTEAEQFARAMNEAWPEIYHWAAPLPPPPPILRTSRTRPTESRPRKVARARL